MAEEKCLRSMSCKCSMCTGFDVASLLSITRDISSNIKYDDGEGEDGPGAPPPPAPVGRGVFNSPPPVTRKAPVMNTPPVAAPRPARVAQDVAMSEASAAPDTRMEAVADTLSKMEVDASAGPAVSLEELLPKITDKNWKVRKEGFEEAKAALERPGTRADAIEPLLELFPKMCEDANASAMEAGIAAVLAYTINVEPFRKDVVAPVMKRVTDKGFSSRPGIVKLCEELVSAFVEAGAAEETVTALIEGTSNRKPKVPPACLNAILEALKAFGPRVVPLPAIKAALPKLLESTVNGVRPLALSTVVEIHRWTGPALVQDIVSNLRQAQQTEYETLTKDVVLGQAIPTKTVRGAKQPGAGGASGRGGKGGGANGTAALAPAAIDPRDFAETVDLLAKLPRTEFQAKMKLSKWSEKVEALKIVLDLIGPIPKLANGDYYELVSTLKLLSNDSNVNIVAKSVEVLGALSDGLRKNFTQHARTMFPEVLRKLSDKKSVVLNASNNTLDLFLQHSMTIDMMMDDIKAALDSSKNKSPQARVQTLGFVARAVEKKYVSVEDKGLVMEFGAAFVGSIEDTDPTVRKAGVEAFVTLAKASEQTSAWLQGKMDDISRKNPRSYKTILQGLGGEVPAASSGLSSRPSSAGSRKSASESVDVDMSGPPASAPSSSAVKPPAKKPMRGPSSRFGTKPAADAAAKPSAPTRKPAGGATSSSSASSAGGSTDFTPIAVSVSPEEAEEIVAGLNIEDWGTISAGFASPKWLERKSAIEGLETFAKNNSSAMSMRTIEALTVYLSKQVKDFRDSNINVLKSAFQAIGTFAENVASKFPRGVVCLVVPSAAEKIGDRKASETIRNMLLQFCEATSPSYTLGCLMNSILTVKTPLAHIEALNVLGECVKDFGVTLCNPRALVEFAKGGVGLESANPKVRSGATTLLGVMYSQLGPALLPILNLESWKPALAATVESEFKKVGYDEKSAMASVKRHVKDADEAQSAADPGALFGRTDVSSQITKELLADMKCEDDKAAWKKRAAAMDAVQSICESTGCAIEFTKPVQEVMRGLKARLSDSNANLKVKAALVIGIVATSVGPDIGKMSKIMGASLMGGVADNKKNMQAAAVDALHKWVRHNNETSTACVESLLSPLSEGLLNPVGRAELLGWAAEHLPNCEKLELSCLVVPTVQSMMDKSTEAREKAQAVLVEVMKSVGKDTILTTGCRDIKPAQMRSLRPMIDKVCETVERAVPAASAPSLPPKPVVPPQPVVAAPAAEAPAQRPGIPRPGKASPGGNRASGIGTPTRIGIRSQLSRSSVSVVPSMADALDKVDSASLLRPNTSKPARLAKAQYNKWVFDTTSMSEMGQRKSEIEAEWKPYLSPELHAKLFAPSLEKGMLSALDELMVCISNQPEEVVGALDWILKWCTLRIVDNNVQALAKLLEVLVKLFEMLKASQYALDDAEAAILLPYLLQESGQSKPRFRVRFRDIMKLVVDVYSIEKYVVYLAECFTASKNMKSRCECIDMIEYIVTTHGFHLVGKRYIKEVGKFVVAHEKELRESAINALVAVFLRSDGDQDKFYRFVGVTSQQGIDLLSARIKHLPANSFQPASAVAEMPPPPPQRQSAFGFGASSASSLSQSLQSTPTHSMSALERPMPTSGLKQVGSFSSVSMLAAADPEPVEEADVDMDAAHAYEEQLAGSGTDEANAIQELVLRPIEQLLTDSREIVDEASPEYADGVDALKGLYAIINRPEGDAEVEFLRCYVNEILIRLCDCIHASFSGGNARKPLSIMVLSLSLSSLSVILGSEAVDNVQRYAVERVLLEICSKMLDPRMEEFASVSSSTAVDLTTMAPEKKRLFFVFKALFKAMRRLTENVKAGEVYPSVINLLQRVLRNDVGDYNTRDPFNHLLEKDSLDQLVGRMLLQISKVQASALNPFEGIDIFGVLMQMHSFFATLPQNDMFGINIAKRNMEEALRMIATSLTNARPGAFEASLSDLPMSSPVRERLLTMGLISAQQYHSDGFRSSLSVPSLSRNNSGDVTDNSSSQEADGVTRRLFGVESSTSSAAPPRVSTAASRDSLKSRMVKFSASTSPVAARSSFAAGSSRLASTASSSSELGTRRFGSTASVRSSTTAVGSAAAADGTGNGQAAVLRERLEKMRNLSRAPLR